jgi:hypothetical protein
MWWSQEGYALLAQVACRRVNRSGIIQGKRDVVQAPAVARTDAQNVVLGLRSAQVGCAVLVGHTAQTPRVLVKTNGLFGIWHRYADVAQTSNTQHVDVFSWR